MGTFYTGCLVMNHVDRKKSARIPKLLVDTGAENTWIPAATLENIGVKMEKKDVPFVIANGKQLTRNIGYVILRVGEWETIDEVVFAQPGDFSLLGARTLEGMNVLVDARNKKLVASGPMPAAGNKRAA